MKSNEEYSDHVRIFSATGPTRFPPNCQSGRSIMREDILIPPNSRDLKSLEVGRG